MKKIILITFISLLIFTSISYSNTKNKIYVLCDTLKTSYVKKHESLKKGDEIANHIFVIETEDYFDLSKSTQLKKKFISFNSFVILSNKKTARYLGTPTMSYSFDEKLKKYKDLKLTFNSTDSTKKTFIHHLGSLWYNGDKWFFDMGLILRDIGEKGAEESIYGYEGYCNEIDENKFRSY
jgi:hypothetical protein